MAASWLSFISLYNGYLRRCFTGAGLSSQMMRIDNDTTIHFWGPNPNSSSSSSPTKPALLLIQGFGPDTMWQWRHQVSSFARDFALYVPDLVFFGGSFTNSPDRSEVFQAECLAKLLEKIGVEKYYVVGTSYGGFVAYRLGAMWPERVEKVVIASSGVNMRRRDNEELVKRANADNIEDLILPATARQLWASMRLSLYKRPPYVPHFLLNDVIDKMYSRNRKQKLELLKGLTLGQDDSVNISPLPQDVLIVWGEHDHIFLLEKAKELQKLLGEKARLEVITKSSHVPQLENAPQFNIVVKNFLCGLQ